MRSAAITVERYLAGLPADRRAALSAVREVIRKNLPAGYEEGMQFGMIGYYVPLPRYPITYNGQPLGVAALASQSRHMAVYLMGVYASPAIQRWFVSEYKKSGKRLDMGKSCVRFKRLEDLPLELVGQVIARVGVDDYVAAYEESLSAPSRKQAKPKPRPKPKARPRTARR